MRRLIEFLYCTILSRTLLTIVLFLPTCTLSQQKGKTDSTISSEFAKAANAAFVAIRNSMRGSRDVTDLAPDETVQAAINSADGAASSASEASVVQQIKFIAIMRRIELGTYDISPSKATLAKLDLTNGCIAAWRKTLHDLSADQPKECTPDAKN
jgi:hypothetical protein